jgi:hypothetical protein
MAPVSYWRLHGSTSVSLCNHNDIRVKHQSLPETANQDYQSSSRLIGSSKSVCAISSSASNRYQQLRTSFSRIILASPMLSETTDVKRGDGLLMSGSLASRTAAIIDAAITSVEANRSVIHFCSAIALVRSCSSRATARRISPMHHRRFAI